MYNKIFFKYFDLILFSETEVIKDKAKATPVKKGMNVSEILLNVQLLSTVCWGCIIWHNPVSQSLKLLKKRHLNQHTKEVRFPTIPQDILNLLQSVHVFIEQQALLYKKTKCYSWIVLKCEYIFLFFRT